jgi:hypothetical protein
MLDMTLSHEPAVAVDVRGREEELGGRGVFEDEWASRELSLLDKTTDGVSSQATTTTTTTTLYASSTANGSPAHLQTRHQGGRGPEIPDRGLVGSAIPNYIMQKIDPRPPKKLKLEAGWRSEPYHICSDTCKILRVRAKQWGMHQQVLIGT